MNLKDEINQLKATLATERDELRVHAHLFKSELKDEWESVEQKWGKFHSKTDHVLKAGHDAASDVFDASKLLATEIADAYRKIRNSL